MMNSLKYIVYPPMCVCCNGVIPINIDFNGNHVCDSCLTILKNSIETENLCHRCSGRLNMESKTERETQTCADCLENENEIFYDKNLSFLQYNQYFGRMLRNYKFGQNKHIGKVFIKIIEDELLENREFFESFDYITYIPVHKVRLKSRGFNQSQVLTKYICEKLNIGYYNILIKTRNIQPQSTVDREMKIENVKNVFSTNEEIDLENKKVLVIDDIFTSGNTVNECAKTLRNSGCGQVCSFTIFKVSKKL